MGSGLTKQGTTQPAAPAAMSYKLNIKGRMLLRDIDPDAPESSRDSTQERDRINKLMASFKTISFVKDVDESSQKFDLLTDKRMVGFEFTVIIDPKNPL
jgi:hypothetical protein